MFEIVFPSTGYKVHFAARLFPMTQFYFPTLLAIRKFSTVRLCPTQLCLKVSTFIKEAGSLPQYTGIQTGVFSDCFVDIRFHSVSLRGLCPGSAVSSALGAWLSSATGHRGTADVSERGKAAQLRGSDHCPGSEPRSNCK